MLKTKTYLMNNLELTNKKNFTIKTRKDYVEYYKSLLIENNEYDYKKLEKKRLFGVSPNIGCFNLERFNFDIKLFKASDLNDIGLPLTGMSTLPFLANS